MLFHGRNGNLEIMYEDLEMMWGPRLTPLMRLHEDAAQDNLLLYSLEIMVLGFVELHKFCDSTPWRCQCANCVRDLEFAELRC
ncbi:hypothetical protein NC651_032008 [Populus alba x Populus x berolinensis]|nr:hypothetical protein NC651_032008 [Populus alba x Populus x berolinensis]